VQNYLLTTLDGGTRVVTEPLPSVRSAAIGLWIGTGSRDEDDAHAGVSHFLEHLLFKGTGSYSALEIAEIFDTFGGELNAATARDYTVVYGRVLDEHLEKALDVMTDMVFAPSLADLDAEREVVLEEIAMVEDTPQELIFDLVTSAVFGNHPLGRPVLGSADVISSVSRRSLGSFHRRRYRVDNVVVATAGSVDHDRLVKLVETMAAKAPAPPARKPSARAPLVAPPPPSLVFQKKATEQYHVCLSAPGIARSDRRRFTASILDGVLGGSASSRLFQEIREKRGLAYAVYTFSSQYADTGQIGVYLGTREENLGECLRIVAEQVEVIARDGPRPDELERAKENLKGRIMLSMELTSNRMSRLGKSLITDSELLGLDRILAEIEAVDTDSVAQLAAVLLPPEAFSVAAIGPNEERLLEAVEPVCPGLVERAAA
jgi:predicted Zn-dependent peptidase